MKTVNRGWLRKQIEAGKVTMVVSYHFDDQFGAERTGEEMERPVEIRNENNTSKDGIVKIHASDLTGHGRAWWANEEKRIVHLRVHSNCSYDLKIHGS